MSNSTHGSAAQASETTQSTDPEAGLCAATEALPENERFIRQMAELSPVVLDVFDLSTERHSYRGSNTVSLFGYTADEIDQMKDIFSVRVHPEDLPRVRDNMARLKRLEDGETLEFECRVRRRDRCVAKTILRRNCTAANLVGQTIRLSIRGFHE